MSHWIVRFLMTAVQLTDNPDRDILSVLHCSVGNSTQQTLFDFAASAAQNNCPTAVLFGLLEQIITGLKVCMGRNRLDIILVDAVVSEDSGMGIIEIIL